MYDIYRWKIKWSKVSKISQATPKSVINFANPGLAQISQYLSTMYHRSKSQHLRQTFRILSPVYMRQPGLAKYNTCQSVTVQYDCKWTDSGTPAPIKAHQVYVCFPFVFLTYGKKKGTWSESYFRGGLFLNSAFRTFVFFSVRRHWTQTISSHAIDGDFFK